MTVGGIVLVVDVVGVDVDNLDEVVEVVERE